MLTFTIINLFYLFLGSLQMTWMEYKRRHGLFVESGIRGSSSMEEDQARATFEINVKYIEEYNRNRTSGQHWLGINSFTHYTKEEFARRFLGPSTSEINKVSSLRASRKSRPRQTEINYWDWRKKGYVSRPRYQGLCYAGYAFSATSGIESVHYNHYGKKTVLSSQQIVDCSYAEGNRGCIHGETKYSYNYTKRNGLTSVDYYPYDYASLKPLPKAAHGECRAAGKPIIANIGGWIDINPTEESLIDALQVSPFSVTVDASLEDFRNYKGGAYDNDKCSKTYLNHAMLVVGVWWHRYKYYIVKNSWGDLWGYAGYMRIIRGKNMCGIANRANYPYI